MTVIYNYECWQCDEILTAGQLAFLKAREPKKLLHLFRFNSFLCGKSHKRENVVEVNELKPVNILRQ